MNLANRSRVEDISRIVFAIVNTPRNRAGRKPREWPLGLSPVFLVEAGARRVGETDRDTDRAPQVSYSHTPLGADLTVQLWGLVSWIGNHTNDILEAQVRRDAATIHP